MASQGGVNVNLRKFVMKSIPQDAVAVFIGRRRTGKSTLVRDLLFHHKDLPINLDRKASSNSKIWEMIPTRAPH